MSAEIVTAVYRARPGQEAALAALIEEHTPLLVAQGLATDRAPIVMRSPTDGTFVEVLEWVDAAAASKAHENSAVSAHWQAMGEIAAFLTLADLPEASIRFAHFDPV